MPELGVSEVMRWLPRSGRNTPVPGRRKNGATSSRSICTSESFLSANNAQSGLVPPWLASTSMRRMMPSSPGAVESCTLPAVP